MVRKRPSRTNQSKRKTTKTVMPVDVAIILDESGSMFSCEEATRSSVAEFLLEQQKNKHVASVTLTKFNTVCTNALTMAKPKSAVFKPAQYQPHGMTALHDAVGTTIEAIAPKVPKGHRVLCCIITDGEENSSREYTLTQVKALIEAKQAEGNWTFVFLGANQDAWAAGMKMGVPLGNAANYTSTNVGTRSMMSHLSHQTIGYSGQAGGQSMGFFGSTTAGGVIDTDDQDLTTGSKK